MALQNGQRYLKFVNGHKFVEVNIKPRQRQIIQQLGKLTAYWRWQLHFGRQKMFYKSFSLKKLRI